MTDLVQTFYIYIFQLKHLKEILNNIKHVTITAKSIFS